MKIETYEVEEIRGEAGLMAADSEAIDLCTKLGLCGQLTLANPDTATRQPYRRMTALEYIVFSEVCPERTSVDAYRSGIIPLRVLQVIAHCRENSLFRRIEVWHPEDVKLDPVLVGVNPHPEHEWQEELYLLARWGEVWKEFPALVKDAKKAWLANAKCKLTKIASQVRNDLESIDAIADGVFTTGKAHSMHYP